MNEFFLYLISIMILVFGALTVTSHKIFRSAIYLLFTLISIAALYFYLEYEFIAAVQIVVYVGGIVVLILFSLFLTHRVGADLPAPSYLKMFFTFLSVLFAFGFVYSLVIGHEFPEAEAIGSGISMNSIGKAMLNYGEGGFVLPFEVVSILLLAALIGSIAIAFKTKVKNS
ncbi:MAG: NADH-quinone oxidoreductase subunit J [Bacteroidetes bacterium]|nr:MAG: NADH-quinone oxidoreductase subunit J [Bacteroidota bacterium]